MEPAKRIDLTKYLFINLWLLLFLIISVFVGLSSGPVNIKYIDIVRGLFGYQPDPLINQILFEIRLPRVLFAVAVGGGLSIAGAVFQAILINPLAEPYILGISSGGTFGAVLSFVLGISFIGTQVFAFSGAFLVMLLVFVLSKKYGELEPNQLLLTGVMIGAFFSAGILLMMTLLNDSLRTAVYWLIGNLSLADKSNLIFVLPITFFVSITLALMSNKFNVLSMGSSTAKQLGINVSKVKNITYLLTSLMIGTLVSVAGIVGFVGLLIPHVCRLMFGTDNRVILPASFFIGAVYLIFTDTLARTIAAPVEIPVGAVTALIGAPVFILLLKKRFYIPK